jgi:manganese transport protein
MNDTSTVHYTKQPGFLRRWLYGIAPGLITAALVFGPSKITIACKLGAEYEFALLWAIVVTIFFMIIFTSIAARIGLATKQSLLTTIREKWGGAAAIIIGLCVFFVTAAFQAGNSIGIGLSLSELTHTRPLGWIISFNLFAISLLFFRSFYKVLEKVMIVLIGLMLLAFLTTLILSKPSVPGILHGLTPSMPKGSVSLVIAFTASCFSIVGAFYQSYLVQERKRLQPNIQQSDRSFTGIFILGLLSAIVLICSATVLFPQGIHLNSAADMAKALEPLFGRYASVLFLSGLFGASFSALIGNASVGGTILGDALGYGSKLSSISTRLLIALLMCIGAVVAIIFGKLPLELIILAQRVTIIIVPFIACAMLFIANDKRIMKNFTNTHLLRISGAIGLGMLIILAVKTVVDFFSHGK